MVNNASAQMIVFVVSPVDRISSQLFDLDFDKLLLAKWNGIFITIAIYYVIVPTKHYSSATKSIVQSETAWTDSGLES